VIAYFKKSQVPEPPLPPPSNCDGEVNLVLDAVIQHAESQKR